MVASNSRLLAFRRLSARLGIRLAPPMPMPKPMLFSERCFPLFARSLFNARLLGDMSDGSLEILAICAGTEKLSCGVCKAADSWPHCGIFASALTMSSPFPIDEAKLALENLFVHLDPLLECVGRSRAICGGLSLVSRNAPSVESAFSTSLCNSVVTAIEFAWIGGMGRDIVRFEGLECRL